MSPGGFPERARWMRRDLFAAAIVLTFVAAQVTLPLILFTIRGGVFGFDQEPRTGELPLSWQMFTFVPDHPTASVTYADGTIGTVDLVEVLGSAGARMDYDDSGGRAACAAIPDAVIVTSDVRGTMITTRC